MSELDYWNGRLIKGAISRREFMGRAAALGASSLAISTLLASAAAAAADAPKSGGVLKLGLAGGSTTDSLDFRTTTDSVMIDSNHGIWNCLAEWGQDGKPHPELAESWEATNGAKDWVLNLRKGVTFSNGKEFNADDANLLAQPPPGRHEIRRRHFSEGRHRHQEAQRPPDPDLALRSRRRFPLWAHRLSSHDGSGRL